MKHASISSLVRVAVTFYPVTWAMSREHYVKTNSPFPPISKYLLLTEFEGRTVSFVPSFFSPFDLYIEGDQENEVSKIPVISLMCVWRVRERFLFKLNLTLQISDAPSKENESIWYRD